MRVSIHTSARAIGPLATWTRPCPFISLPPIQVRNSNAALAWLPVTLHTVWHCPTSLRRSGYIGAVLPWRRATAKQQTPRKATDMPSPFPGMDPYLEHYELWESVHAFLIGAVAENLSPRIRPLYRVSIQQRFYVLEAQEQLTVGVADALLSRAGAHATGPTGRDGARDGAQAHPREA